MSAPEREPARGAERAARLRAMGHILHEADSDEEADAPPASGQDTADAALRREVPPHHGG